jgi:hypothetical protein
MKIGFLITLLVTGIHFCTFAQETSADKIFDYSETKHEFSLNIAPIIVGSYPADLLYRRHYISKNGKNVALRVGATLGADMRSLDLDSPSGGNVQKINSQSFGVYIGKEWQRNIHPRILGYYGADLASSYGREFNDFKDNNLSQPSSTSEYTFLNLGAVGFLGMRYHFSENFSLSVETSASFNYSKSTNSISQFTQTALGYQTTKRNSLNLNMSPLSAIRFSFHF